MGNSLAIPALSTSALQELRRIYCKHLLEVFASPETQELYERGCIAGHFAETEHRGFIVDEVTPLGVAALQSYES